MLKNKTILVLFVAVVIGFITRGFELRQRFLYAHDGDLASWIVKDIVVNKHPRLIGQLTSSQGIFIGPLFYYALIPFYLLTNMDPVGGLAIPLITGIAAIVSVYWVIKRLFDHTTAAFASLIYAVSFLISQTEREMVPTTPVMLWSIWFFYFINELYAGHKKALVGLAVLFSLIWHLNLALALLFPIVIHAILLNRKIFLMKDFFKPLLILFILSAPLWLFEIKHNFIQTSALVDTLLSSGTTHSDFSQKIIHVAQYSAKNATHIFWDNPIHASEYLVPAILLFILIGLIIFKKVPRYYIWLFSFWIGLNILFFALQSLNLSEYYLNSINVLWLILFALLLSVIYSSKYLKIISSAIMGGIIFWNLNSFFTSNINHFGYLEKKALVDYIYTDARKHNYPCVSVSYITNPGYNLGYRYFFYLKKLHVNQPSSGSPVYSIVFPHSLVNHLDKTFGALGVINPDYGRYSDSAVKISCQGPDANLTDPMFGFTK